MCFSAKVKTPKVDTKAVQSAVAPAPLIESPKAVLYGGQDDDDDTTDSGTSSEVSSGKKSVTVEQKTKPKTMGLKASIRKAAGGK